MARIESEIVNQCNRDIDERTVISPKQRGIIESEIVNIVIIELSVPKKHSVIESGSVRASNEQSCHLGTKIEWAAEDCSEGTNGGWKKDNTRVTDPTARTVG